MIAQQRDKLAAIELPDTIDAATRASAQRAVANAFVSGFRWIMVISALMCFASALAALLWIDGARPRRPVTESRKA
jgi:hypothetical protein